jgi:phage tail-like protein
MAVDSKKTSSYLQYLPAIYSEKTGEEIVPFVGRFLLAFEQILTGLPGSEGEPSKGLEEIIADIPRLFDPGQTPTLEFLEWLAGWVALSLRADWTLDQQREFLARIVPLYRRRGTKQNLAELLRIYTGLEPVITEAEGTVFQIGVHSTIGVDTQINGSAPHYFRVSVTIPNPDPSTLQRQHQIVTALIEQEKPAHTAYDLELKHSTMQIGVRSTIGVNTLLGQLPKEEENVL